MRPFLWATVLAVLALIARPIGEALWRAWRAPGRWMRDRRGWIRRR